MIYPNGDTYEGNFEEQQREGFGTFTNTYGDKYEGRWKDDVKSGFCREYIADTKEYFEGFYDRGERDGEGTLVLANREVQIVNYRNGKLFSTTEYKSSLVDKKGYYNQILVSKLSGEHYNKLIENFLKKNNKGDPRVTIII